MERDRRIEMEVNVATEIAKTLLNECGALIGRMRMEATKSVPRRAARCAHELVEHVLRNNCENLGQDE